MIQVQIATSVSETGVGDLRWVLIDPSEAPAAADDAAPAMADEPPPAARRTAWLLRMIQALLLLSALFGAWWATWALPAVRGVAHASAPAESDHG